MRNGIGVAVLGMVYATATACSSAPQTAQTESPGAQPAAEQSAGAATTPAVTDAEIAAIVVAANTIDAELGELAASRSATPSVQEFGRTMTRDHRAVNASAVALVTKLGVTPLENDVSRQLQAEAAAVRAQLEKLSGGEFDRAYIDREVSYHTAVIDAVDKLLLPNAQNQELRITLTEVRPALVAHLQHAQHLATSLAQSR